MNSSIIASDRAFPHISEVIDIEALRALFESYSQNTGMVTALLDLEGNVLIATNWQDSCTQFHRQNATTQARCIESDTALAGSLEKGERYVDYKCRNGLVDVATPVTIEGEHVANFFTGQFFYAPPDLEYFAKQADEAGFDKAAYLNAIQRVPVYNEAVIRSHMQFLVNLAEMIGRIGAANLRYKKVNEELTFHKENLEQLVATRTQELEASLLQAEEANHAKTAFLSNMSHELRTPLNSILGFSEILAAKEVDATKQRYLNIVRSAGTGLLTLLNSILDLSRIESGKMPVQKRAIHLPNLIREVSQIFSRQALEKGIELNVSISSDTPHYLHVDDAKLRQTLINLVSNAIKFTQHGSVSISTKLTAKPTTSFKRPTPKEITRRVDEHIQFSVSDTGIGVSPSDQKRIFNAFEQSKNQSINDYGGTGLGLALCKQFIELLGGALELESQVNQGSRFFFSIPNDVITDLLIINQLEGAPSNTSASSLRFKQACVLVVDDNELNRDLLVTYLSQWQIHCEQASNGLDAIAKARSLQPDLILMDMKMPGLDGFAASTALKKHSDTASIPIVMVTASVLKHDEERILKTVDGFVRKPIQRNALETLVMRFLSHKASPISPEVLVVDDSDINRLVLCEILQSLGVDVRGQADCGEACLQAVCRTERPDVIFMDYHMPGLNGWETAKQIREWESQHGYAPISIYVLSAMNKEDLLALDSEQVFTGVITKPVDTQQLAVILKRV